MSESPSMQVPPPLPLVFATERPRGADPDDLLGRRPLTVDEIGSLPLLPEQGYAEQVPVLSMLRSWDAQVMPPGVGAPSQPPPVSGAAPRKGRGPRPSRQVCLCPVRSGSSHAPCSLPS